MSEYDLWLKGCDINHDTIFRLEGKGNTGLYKVGKAQMIEHREFSQWVYSVWVRGEHIATLTDYLSAVRLYENRTKGMDV